MRSQPKIKGDLGRKPGKSEKKVHQNTTARVDKWEIYKGKEVKGKGKAEIER